MKFTLLLSMFLLLATKSNAYILASKKGLQSEKHIKKDVFVIAEGGKLNLLFFKTAMTSIKKHQEIYPEREIIVIWAKEHGLKEDREVLQKTNLREFFSSSDRITPEVFISTLNQLKNVSSIHFYAHAAAQFGIALQENFGRFHSGKARRIRHRKVFNSDAYAYFYGCNTGFDQAKAFSKAWNIPAFGSLSSTDFQELHTDGQWYHHNDGQFPKTGSWKSINNQSFLSDKSCSDFSCHRMKPDLTPYKGKWGGYGGTLPFFKAFCNFKLEKKSNQEKCMKAMYQSILVYPSTIALGKKPNFEKYKKVVKDFLCPIKWWNNLRSECEAVLDRVEETQRAESYSTETKNRTFSCSFYGCDYQLERQSKEGRSFLAYILTGNEDFKTLTNEYLIYLNAYKMINN